MSLAALQTEWIRLHDELSKAFPSDALAAPFLSVQTDASVDALKRPILLVGKATHKGWRLDKFLQTKDKPVTARIAERKEATSDFLSKHAGTDRSFFWKFYRDLKTIRSFVIWTNLAKIGVYRPEGDNRSKNPEGDFLTCQKELAKETLHAEMEEYKPALVVLVTSTYAAEEIAHPVFGAKNIWKTPDDSIWWQRRTQTQPPILWVDHPGFKPKKERDRWIKKAQELIS